MYINLRRLHRSKKNHQKIILIGQGSGQFDSFMRSASISIFNYRKLIAHRIRLTLKTKHVFQPFSTFFVHFNVSTSFWVRAAPKSWSKYTTPNAYCTLAKRLPRKIFPNYVIVNATNVSPFQIICSWYNFSKIWEYVFDTNYYVFKRKGLFTRQICFLGFLPREISNKGRLS